MVSEMDMLIIPLSTYEFEDWQLFFLILCILEQLANSPLFLKFSNFKIEVSLLFSFCLIHVQNDSLSYGRNISN